MFIESVEHKEPELINGSRLSKRRPQVLLDKEHEFVAVYKRICSTTAHDTRTTLIFLILKAQSVSKAPF